MTLLDHRVPDARNDLPVQPGGPAPVGAVNQTEPRRPFPWKTLLLLIGMVATSVIISATTISIVRRRRSPRYEREAPMRIGQRSERRGARAGVFYGCATPRRRRVRARHRLHMARHNSSSRRHSGRDYGMPMRVTTEWARLGARAG
jgi:hypothetical protein